MIKGKATRSSLITRDSLVENVEPSMEYLLMNKDASTVVTYTKKEALRTIFCTQHIFSSPLVMVPIDKYEIHVGSKVVSLKKRRKKGKPGKRV